jgi:two-component system cell cycle sensor histidine kinase/response regulator CckA
VEQAYLTVIVLTHLAFAGIFLFLYRYARRPLLGAFAAAWMIEAVRTLVLQAGALGHPVSHHLYTMADLLYLPVTVLLLAGTAEAVGRPIPKRALAAYAYPSLALLLVLYAAQSWLMRRSGGAHPALGAMVQAKLLVMFVPGAAARFVCMAWLVAYGRRHRALGALLAGASFFPHAIGSLIVPIQYYFGFFPPSLHLFWFVQILGVSVGSIVLFFNKQLAELRETQTALQDANEKLEERVRVRTAELTTANESLVKEAAERLRAEQTAHDSEEQLRQALKMEAVGRLAGGIAHDFNNLLTVILGQAERAARALGPAHATRPLLDDVVSAGERAAGLIRQLLAFGRKQRLAPAVVDLNVEVRSLEAMLRRLIGDDIRVRSVASAEPAWVRVDRAQIGQVLLNLAVNARDAMPRGGELVVQVERTIVDDGDALRRALPISGPYVRLAVSDTGQGMDGETAARIFEPFFTTKAAGQGTGLGLATVYGIVTQSGGAVTVESVLGRGTTFEILLPRMSAPAAVAATPTVRRRETAGGQTVLVVDDEARVRHFVQAILEEAGYRVLVADGSTGALGAADQFVGPIDLVLTDAFMPGMNGPEMVERLHPQRPESKVLYMTGHTDHPMVAGPILEALIRKPFSGAELLRCIRQILDS